MNGDILTFVQRLYALLLEGVELDDAVDEAINVTGWPDTNDELEQEVFVLRTRRELAEWMLAREEERLAGAVRQGANAPVLAARARVAAARHRLTGL